MELVSPAGSPDRMALAFAWGADAVYAGAKNFSLRARAENFSNDELKGAIELARAQGRAFYLAVNAFFDDQALGELGEFLAELGRPGPSALIVSDPGAMAVSARVRPDLPLHVSTQANTMNTETIRFWRETFGIKRVVLARELELGQIERICKALDDVECEVFVHGAMCVAYSGRCLLSSYLTSKAFLAPGEPMPGKIDRVRSANRGDCSQTCRWSFGLVEEKREGEVLKIVEEEGKTMLLSSRDLCMVDHLLELKNAGVSALKIEGRMKSQHYVAVTSGVYRAALDLLRQGLAPSSGERDLWHRELGRLTRREYSTGFFYPDNRAFLYSQCEEEPDCLMAGIVLSRESGSFWLCRARNPIKADSKLSLIMPGLKETSLARWELYDLEKKPLDLVRPNQEFFLKTDHLLSPHAILRLPNPAYGTR